MSDESKLKLLLDLADCMRDSEPTTDVRIADSRDGRFYHHGERIRLALKVALITGRPLLLVGPPGCGKSSLAPYVARNLNLKYLTYTVTENAEASDMLWRIDYVKRLNDAQIAGGIKPLEEYIERGVLWRAFRPDTDDELGTLVLIDEIDKADSSFSNSLLVAIGSMQFDVPSLENRRIFADSSHIVVVVLTSNEERELPPALMRRCVVLRVKYPTAVDLIKITESRWADWMAEPGFRTAVERMAERLTAGREADEGRPPVSTAEFLDLVQVLRKGDVHPEDPVWQTIENLVLVQGVESDG